MSQSSKIEWTDHTFNPWWGCHKISPACRECYADSLANRLGFKIWGQDAPRRFFGGKHWEEPLRWNRSCEKRGVRERVFCGSMCDVFEDRDDLIEARTKLFEIIDATPRLIWMLLTKRPENLQDLCPREWVFSMTGPKNVGLGVTVESSDYLMRIDEVVQIAAAFYFVSAEPLLGKLDLAEPLAMKAIDWVIVGGESGPGARPMHPDWVRTIRDQCEAAGVPFFFKQWGEWTPWIESMRDTSHGTVRTVAPAWAHGGDKVEMARVGKKAAGATLDGWEWRQMPEVRNG